MKRKSPKARTKSSLMERRMFNLIQRVNLAMVFIRNNSARLDRQQTANDQLIEVSRKLSSELKLILGFLEERQENDDPPNIYQVQLRELKLSNYHLMKQFKALNERLIDAILDHQPITQAQASALKKAVDVVYRRIGRDQTVEEIKANWKVNFDDV